MKEKIPCGIGMDLMVRAAVNREAWALRAVVGAEPAFQVDVATDSEFFKKCLYPFQGKGVAPGEAGASQAYFYYRFHRSMLLLDGAALSRLPCPLRPRRASSVQPESYW
jgi:hypothetical protein